MAPGIRDDICEQKHREIYLKFDAEDLGLEELQRTAVDLDESLSLLAVSDSGSSLLATEGLNRLHGRRHYPVKTD